MEKITPLNKSGRIMTFRVNSACFAQRVSQDRNVLKQELSFALYMFDYQVSMIINC